MAPLLARLAGRGPSPGLDGLLERYARRDGHAHAGLLAHVGLP
jgi:hypothetical protein